MQVGKVTLPCGCESRKEIMFVAGRPGLTEAMILGTAVSVMLAAIIFSYAKVKSNVQ